VSDWRASTALTDDERLVVEYAEQLSMTPANVSDEVHRQLRVRFSEKQIVELTNNIAWENARARFNRGFRIEPDGYVVG
jgi:alkylhydroperoxidase family enzyme